MATPTGPGKSFRIPIGDDTSQALERKIAQILALGAGVYGVDFVTGAASGPAASSPWGAIQAVTDTVIGSITFPAGYATGTITGGTIPAGTVLLIRFTAITVTSGTVVLYRTAP